MHADFHCLKKHSSGAGRRAKRINNPKSCHSSAECPENDRDFFEKKNIFPKGTINRTISLLKSYNDSHLSEQLYGNSEEIAWLVETWLHCKQILRKNC